MAGWVPLTPSQHHDFQNSISQRTALGSTVGHVQQVLENVMSEVDKERKLRTCEPMSDDEKRLDARRDLQKLIASVSLQTSSFGKLSSQESMVFKDRRRQKRVVAQLRVKVAAETRLASLRRLTSKVNKQAPAQLSAWC